MCSALENIIIRNDDSIYIGDIRRIGSVFTYSTEKIELSAFDTKRWICDDGISTYAFGHWKTELYICHTMTKGSNPHDVKIEKMFKMRFEFAITVLKY